MCEVATQRFNQLQDLFRRVLQRREEQLGAKHLQTLAAVRNLAKNLRSQQKFKEAEDREAKTCSFQFAKWLSGSKISPWIQLIISALLEATGKIHQSLDGFGRFWKLPCLGCRNFIGEPWKVMKISWASQIKKLCVWPANWQPYYRTVRVSGVKTQTMLIKSESKHWRFRRLHFLINRMSIVSRYLHTLHRCKNLRACNGSGGQRTGRGATVASSGVGRTTGDLGRWSFGDVTWCA